MWVLNHSCSSTFPIPPPTPRLLPSSCRNASMRRALSTSPSLPLELTLYFLLLIPSPHNYMLYLMSAYYSWWSIHATMEPSPRSSAPPITVVMKSSDRRTSPLRPSSSPFLSLRRSRVKVLPPPSLPSPSFLVPPLSSYPRCYVDAPLFIVYPHYLGVFRFLADHFHPSLSS